MGHKIFRKLNLVDLLLLCLVITCVITMVYRVIHNEKKDNSAPFLLTFVCQDAPDELLSEITVNLECLDGTSGITLGQLVSFDFTSDKKVFKTNVHGVLDEHGVLFDDHLYPKGKKIQLLVGECLFDVYLSEIHQIYDNPEKERG